MIYPITPIGKPRMTRADAWKKRPAVLRYWAFKDECAKHGVYKPDKPHIVFYMPMPKSWSKKKKAAMNGQPHTQKSDLDNLLKALWDSTCVDDAHIWCVYAEKVWSYEGKIKISDMG